MTAPSPRGKTEAERGAAGRLYIVSTPIGNLEDITLRALRLLRECDLIAAEDTRRTRKLLSHYDIHTPLTGFRQHRQARQAPAIVEKIRAGASVALVTDAGTPGISDPGWYLIDAALAHGLEVIPAPGPSAAVTLLSVSGLPTDRFIFEGFLPVKGGKRKKRLGELAGDSRTMVFYESPHRLLKTLEAMSEVFGDRPAAVGREMTKVFEEVRRGSLGSILEHLRGQRIRGEITLAVAGREGGD